MVNKDFFQALLDLQEQKGIDQQYFIEALESALTSAYKKNFGEAKSATVKLNPEKCTIRIYSYKTVVEEVLDSDKEISLPEARLIKKSFKVGDIVQQEESPKNFGRIAAQTAKQVVMQRLREAERNRVFDEVNTKQDELVTGIVRRVELENVYVDLGMTQFEGVLGLKDQIPGERYKVGDRIKVVIRSIKDGYNAPFVQLSRSNANFVRKLFELEIPEIANGEITIKNIVREAGYRTKIAVATDNSNLDCIGACVGNKGMRVNAVVNELSGEKIDIIPYSEDAGQFIISALSPATVLYIHTNMEEKSSLVVVPDDKLSLAIGKAGQNVRLAAKLTGWKIDVKAKSTVPSLNLDENNQESENYKDLFEDDDAFGDVN